MTSTDSGIPDEWWNTAEIIQEETYVTPTYTPSDEANRNHNLFSDWRDNNLDVDGGKWIEDLATGFGIILLIGLILLILFMFMRCCCFKRDTCCVKAKQKGSTRTFAQIIFWTSWVASVVGTVFMVIALAYAYYAIQRLGRDAGYIADYLEDVQEITKTASSLADVVIERSNTAVEVIQECIDENLPSFADPIVIENSDLTDNISVFIDDVDSIAFDEDIEDAITLARDISNDIKDNDDETYGNAFFFGFLNGACLLGFAFLSLYLIIKDRKFGSSGCCSRVIYYTLMMLIWLMTIFGWFIFASSVFSNMVMGDFCQSPDEYILEKQDNNEVILYYMTCTTVSTDSNSFNVRNSIIEGQEILLESMQTTVDAFSLAAELDECADIVEEQQNLVTDAGYNVNELLYEAAEQLKCEEINSLYVKAIHTTVCNHGNKIGEFIMIGFLLQSCGFLLCLYIWGVISNKKAEINMQVLATTGTMMIINQKPQPSAPLAS